MALIHHTQRNKAEHLRFIRAFINSADEINPSHMKRELFNNRSLPPATIDRYLKELEEMGEFEWITKEDGSKVMKSTQRNG